MDEALNWLIVPPYPRGAAVGVDGSRDTFLLGGRARPRAATYLCAAPLSCPFFWSHASKLLVCRFCTQRLDGRLYYSGQWGCRGRVRYWGLGEDNRLDLCGPRVITGEEGMRGAESRRELFGREQRGSETEAKGRGPSN